MDDSKVEENGSDSTIAAQAVEHFPSIFRQTNRKANREKARRWWKTRNDFLSAIVTLGNKSLSISTSRQRGCAVRRTQIKALRGRGRKRYWWKNILHEFLRDEFSRLRSAGVKINTDFLRRTVISLVRDDQTVPVPEQDVIEATGKE